MKLDVQELWDPRASQDKRVSPATVGEEEQMEVLVCQEVLEALEPKVCRDLLVWMD